MASYSMHEIVAVIEALLFTSDRPLSLYQLSCLLPEFDRKDVETALELLHAGMQRKSRGVELAKVDGGYIIRSKPDIASWIIRAIQPDPVKLSRAAMETLAVVAYRQPVTRAEIEETRGVDASGTLRVLIERGLIKAAGRKKVPGRPLLYATTSYFLELFQLDGIDSLPDMQEMRKSQALTGIDP